MCIFVGTVTNGSDPNTGLEVVTNDTASGTYFGFYGLGGNDTLTYTGSDTCFMYGGEDDDTLNFDSTGTSGFLFGDAGDDYINFQGSDGGTLDGGLGNDTILDVNSRSASHLLGGEGNDSLQANQNNDTLQGGGGDDIIDCGNGDDFAEGQGGKDIIMPGKGRDIIYGGSGVDHFEFDSVTHSGNTSATRDRIMDFNPGSAATVVDKIDLSGIGGLTFITGGFTAAGQVRVIQQGLNTIVQVNTVGPSGPEMTIQLSNVDATKVTGLDFIL